MPTRARSDLEAYRLHIYSSWHDRRTKVAQTGLGSSVGAVQSVRVTYVLVVNDHPLLTGGLVGAQVLVNAPVTAPSAQSATTATARRNDRMYGSET